MLLFSPGAKISLNMKIIAVGHGEHFLTFRVGLMFIIYEK